MIISQTQTQTIQTINPNNCHQAQPTIKPTVSTSHFNCSVGAYGNQVSSFINQTHQWANSQLTRPGTYTARTLERGYQNHANRLQASGRRPMSYGQYQNRVINRARSIINGPGSRGYKIARLVKLGRATGIHPIRMLNLARHIKRADQQALGRLSQYQHQQLNCLSGQLATAQNTYGCQSPQALASTQKMEVLNSQVNSASQKYLDQGQQLKTCKPKKKKKGFFGKLKGFFKKAVGGLAKVVRFARPFLPMIPGFGTMAAMAADGFLAVYDAVKSKGKSLANAGMTYLQNKFPSLGGANKATQAAA